MVGGANTSTRSYKSSFSGHSPLGNETKTTHITFPTPETTSQVAVLNIGLQEEKTSGKKLRGQVQQLEEELGEARGEKEVLEKVGGLHGATKYGRSDL